MSMITDFSRWLHLKQYQLEVTFCVYIFTPWEKFAFYTIFFLLSSLTFIATVLYLPQHIAFIVGRAWFYMNGEHVDVVELTKEAVEGALHQTVGLVSTTAAALAGETAEAVVREL
ncbi:hypothetical protein D7B24_002361 [Verticillium nonalfalfae]|uniref:Uncharacterized protein n=1 Tax=Verticillium nonalfalfae TaxID=1051616 RepID=A0A3M9XYN3_9PEZI|nr:uncharacterized protein D7B24_002361 [Verticillium nonalfalfae]RNJ53104.1 hypothetical protein D7B24_002361 [Verticillium nonalfalfae]